MLVKSELAANCWLLLAEDATLDQLATVRKQSNAENAHDAKQGHATHSKAEQTLYFEYCFYSNQADPDMLPSCMHFTHVNQTCPKYHTHTRMRYWLS